MHRNSWRLCTQNQTSWNRRYFSRRPAATPRSFGPFRAKRCTLFVQNYLNVHNNIFNHFEFRCSRMRCWSPRVRRPDKAPCTPEWSRSNQCSLWNISNFCKNKFSNLGSRQIFRESSIYLGMRAIDSTRRDNLKVSRGKKCLRIWLGWKREE